jgi:hypothetical protein
VSPVWPGNPVMRLGRRWMRSSWCRIAAASGPVVSGGEVAQAVLHHRPGALTARPRSPPSSSRPRSTAWSTPVRWWCCTPRGTGCRYPPWPAGCSRWASRRPSRRTWPRAGPTVPVGAVIAARPAVSLVGSYELLVWLIRTCGAADRGPSTAHLCTGAACRAARRPGSASAADGERPGTSGSAWRPAGRRAGQSPIPASGQRDERFRRRALSMTRRWPRTGSACRPATRCRNVGSPRCSDAPPAAGREPESPTPGKHRRS